MSRCEARDRAQSGRRAAALRWLQRGTEMRLDPGLRRDDEGWAGRGFPPTRE
jgi:hypothetical protein